VPLLGWMKTAELSTVAVATHETTTRPLVPWCRTTVSCISRSDSNDDSTSSDSLNIQQTNHLTATVTSSWISWCSTNELQDAPSEAKPTASNHTARLLLTISMDTKHKHLVLRCSISISN